jgi:hypothetical protein
VGAQCYNFADTFSWTRVHIFSDFGCMILLMFLRKIHSNSDPIHKYRTLFSKINHVIDL